jgi:hypothetical protein
VRGTDALRPLARGSPARGATWRSSESIGLPSSENQARCSATMSNASRYGPGGMGARTCAATVACSPGASGGAAVRVPSQTIGLSRSSSQWYASRTWSPHAMVPAFASSTSTVSTTPACGAGAGAGPQRTTRGPFDTNHLA